MVCSSACPIICLTVFSLTPRKDKTIRIISMFCLISPGCINVVFDGLCKIYLPVTILAFGILYNLPGVSAEHPLHVNVVGRFDIFIPKSDQFTDRDSGSILKHQSQRAQSIFLDFFIEIFPDQLSDESDLLRGANGEPLDMFKSFIL